VQHVFVYHCHDFRGVGAIEDPLPFQFCVDQRVHCHVGRVGLSRQSFMR
jgi:hypothetical protein